MLKSLIYLGKNDSDYSRATRNFKQALFAKVKWIGTTERLLTEKMDYLNSYT